jgi:hypothetical protein
MPTAAKRKTKRDAKVTKNSQVCQMAQVKNDSAKSRARPGLTPCRIPKGQGAEQGSGRFYANRRHLATAIDPALGGPELKYIIEISDLETVIKTALLRIYVRDGAKIYREAAKILRKDALGWIAATRKHKGWKVKPGSVRRPFVPSIAA